MEKYDVMLNCDVGLESLVKEELEKSFRIDEDKIKIKPFNVDGKILIKGLKLEDIIRLNYCGRGFHRVIILLDKFNISKSWEEDEKIFYERAKNIPFEEFLDKEYITFGVQSTKIGEGFNYTSIDLRRPVGSGVIDRIKEVLGFRPKVFLEDPDLIVRVEVIDNVAIVGIDTTGKRALFKRGWRVFHHRASLKSSTAFLMLLLSEWNKNELLLDPFTGSGTIPIEAALYAKSICPGRFRKYDFAFLKLGKFREIYEDIIKELEEREEKKVKLKIYGFDVDSNSIIGAKKNARMAKVINDINFGVENVKYLFTRFKEKEVDKIVTNPPWGIRIKEKKLGKIYYYFFENAVDILSDKGYIVLITTRATLVKNLVEEFNFKILKEFKVFYEDMHFHLFKIW